MDIKSYALGYSEDEAERLAVQGSFLEEPTEALFRRAGIDRGMKVLDIGSGVGDVSFLAARMVGPDGAVLGVDMSAPSLEIARRRAASLGITNVAFVQGDLATLWLEQTFDALVGRLVLLYVPDPVATVRRLSRCVRPGGVVAFNEYDTSAASQTPETKVFRDAHDWIKQTLSFSGAKLDMGTALYATFLHAGLPCPQMMSTTRVACGGSSPMYAQMAWTVRSLLPVMERSGIASAEEVDVETLADRLRRAAVEAESVTFSPRLVGAWPKIPRGMSCRDEVSEAHERASARLLGRQE